MRNPFRRNEQPTTPTTIVTTMSPELAQAMLKLAETTAN